MEYSKSYNEATLQISAWKKNYESRTFDFYEKKVTTYMQSRSCNKMNIYCHSNHTLKQDSATTSSSETFNRTDYLHGHGRLENRIAQSLEFLPTRSAKGKIKSSK